MRIVCIEAISIYYRCMTQEHKENDRRQWIVDARAGVIEEHQRLEQNGPSLNRYRRTWLYENRSAYAAQTEQNTVEDN